MKYIQASKLEMKVAIAAPVTFNLKTKIKRGSKIIFIIPPIAIPILAD